MEQSKVVKDYTHFYLCHKYNPIERRRQCLWFLCLKCYGSNLELCMLQASASHWPTNSWQAGKLASEVHHLFQCIAASEGYFLCIELCFQEHLGFFFSDLTSERILGYLETQWEKYPVGTPYRIIRKGKEMVCTCVFHFLEKKNVLLKSIL